MTHHKLVPAMFRPEFYPHRPEHVEFIQTHVSYIFIAGDYLYKVKKAVNFDFLDFTTIERRRFYCNEELRLNRRLAPDVYLDVLEIGEDERGNIVLGKGERIVDYAVLMRKLLSVLVDFLRGKETRESYFVLFDSFLLTSSSVMRFFVSPMK